MRKKNTIIFDLDGTLLNTLEDLTNGFNFALKTFGYSPRTITEVQSFVGNGVQKAIEKCLPYKVSENELEKIIHTFKEYYSAHMFEKTKPYEGIIPLLETLKQEGIKTAVVSNKYDGAVKYLCNYYFKGLINLAIGEGNGVEKKPNPIGVIRVIRELESEKSRCLYIGDSEVDIQTANNAGIQCVSVLWGYKTKLFLEENGGKYFAESPKDIINFL